MGMGICLHGLGWLSVHALPLEGRFLLLSHHRTVCILARLGRPSIVDTTNWALRG